MPALIPFLLSNWRTVLAGAVVAVLLGGAWVIYNKVETAGSSAVKEAVQAKTIETLNNARTTKEQADEEVRRTPYGDRVDGLR